MYVSFEHGAKEVLKQGSAQKVIRRIHESIGHLGVDATANAFNKTYDCDNLFKAVKFMHENCLGCSRNQPVGKSHYPLMPIPPPDQIFRLVGFCIKVYYCCSGGSIVCLCRCRRKG